MSEAKVDVVKAGHPALRAIAKPVSAELREGSAFKELLRILGATLGDSGVGIAAPQIGVSLQVFLMGDKEEFITKDKLSDAKNRRARPLETVINPRWLPVGQEMVTFAEGCLSMPDLQANIARFQKIDARWETPEGREKRETLVDWNARIFQHESDHLIGRLYVDYLKTPPGLFYADVGRGVTNELLKRLGCQLYDLHWREAKSNGLD